MKSWIAQDFLLLTNSSDRDVTSQSCSSHLGNGLKATFTLVGVLQDAWGASESMKVRTRLGNPIRSCGGNLVFYLCTRGRDATRERWTKTGCRSSLGFVHLNLMLTDHIHTVHEELRFIIVVSELVSLQSEQDRLVRRSYWNSLFRPPNSSQRDSCYGQPLKFVITFQ